MNNKKCKGRIRPHLTRDDRSLIKIMLDEGRSLKRIAEKIGKSHSTVSREIRSRRIDSDRGAVGRVRNRRIHRRECDRRQLCANMPDCTRKCSACGRCNSVCPDFAEEVCPRLQAPPYVCNACPDRGACTLRKKFYSAGKAHEDYVRTLSDSRSGPNTTTAWLTSFGELLAPRVAKGQSLHHIMATDPDIFTVSERTAYRYLNAGLLPVRRGDLPRACVRSVRGAPSPSNTRSTRRAGGDATAGTISSSWMRTRS